MLQSIRDRAQGWIAWTIIIALVVAFSLWGVERFFTGSRASNNIAKVAGVNITQSQVSAVYNRLLRSRQAELGGVALTQAQEEQLKQTALQLLVRTLALSLYASKQGYTITMPQINAVLQSIPAFKENGQFSQTRFMGVLNSLSYTQQDFISQLQADMLNYQPQLGIESSNFALPNEVNIAYQLIMQQRDFSYAVIPLANFVKNVSITETQLQAFYKQHLNAFKALEQVKIDYIELNKNDLKKNFKFNDAELEKYYQSNKASFISPTKWRVSYIYVKVPSAATPEVEEAAKNKINKVSKELKAGKPFTNLAKQYSDDIATAKSGGILPWFTPGTVDPIIEKNLKNLKLGQVSEPFRTQLGFAIIRLNDVKESAIEPFAAVKEQIINLIAEEKAQALFATLSDKLADLTYTHADSLQPAAQALNLPIKTSDLFTRRGNSNGITANKKVINAAFSASAIQDGYNSEIIEAQPDVLVVLHVKQYKPESIKPFDEVKEQINNFVVQQQSKIQAQNFGETVINAINNKDEPLDEVAHQYNLKWLNEKNITRADKKLDVKLVQTLFKLSLPSAEKKLKSVGVELSNGDYAIMILDSIHHPSFTAMTNQERQALSQQLAQNDGWLDYKFYSDQLVKEIKVKYLKQK